MLNFGCMSREKKLKLFALCFCSMSRAVSEFHSLTLRLLYIKISLHYQDLDMVLSDCDTALNLNNKYVKALDRRARTLRKQAKKIENFEIQVFLQDLLLNFKCI